MIRAEVGAVAEHGVNQHSGHNNVMSSETQGNRAIYTLRRLKRDRASRAMQLAAFPSVYGSITVTVIPVVAR